jgi:alpha-galactosidase
VTDIRIDSIQQGSMTTMIKPFLIAIACLFGINCCNTPAQEKPLKVFVLVGQSNMQGHAHVRTLPHIGMDPKTRSILDEIQNGKGEPRVIENVWISYLSSSGVKSGQLTTGFGADENKIGPELTFGIYMQKKLNEPILIIKTAWGGKSINTDFRPPSAGPYEFDESVLKRLKKQGKDIAAIQADKQKATGVFYRRTIDHVKKVLANIKSVYPDYDAKRGYELAGLVWFQGWNDMVDGGTYPRRGETGGYDAYSKVLDHLIRDYRKDLSAPNLPFVIGVMGVGGPTEKYTKQQKRYKKIHQNFRDAMAAPASKKEFKGNVVAVLTENYWDLELDAILARDNEIRNKINRFKKEKKLDELIREINGNKELTEKDSQVFEILQKEGKLEQLLLKRMQTEEFTVREYQILQFGKSNAAFHYLGCGKIMAQIGKAFAEAMPVTTAK